MKQLVLILVFGEDMRIDKKFFEEFENTMS